MSEVISYGPMSATLRLVRRPRTTNCFASVRAQGTAGNVSYGILEAAMLLAVAALPTVALVSAIFANRS